MIHYPCKVDGEYFENTRLAHRALFLRDKNISCFKLQRALKRGCCELSGHSIERITQRFTVGLPLHPDDDGSDLVAQPPACDQKPKYKPGEPLLVYPFFERPIDRGLPERWR